MRTFATTIAILLAASGAALAGPPLTVVGSEWCPYNCAQESPLGLGYMIDVAREVFEPAGHAVDYQLITWARAIDEVKAGNMQALVGSSRRDGLIFTKQPLGIAQNGFAVRKGEGFTYTGPDSLKGKVLAAINGYSYTDDVDAIITAAGANEAVVQLVSGDNALTLNLRKLTAKRVDLVVDDVNVLRQQIALMGIADQVDIVPGGLPDPVYLAFSAARPDSQTLADRLDSGIDALRQSGRLRQILDRYHLTDWQQ